ncbi:MAG: hypothetical protein JNM89_13495 [Hyphomicrobiaceae bacterium]|nr:hypothetical protein [Hyphomicrobiaceae bacterium]
MPTWQNIEFSRVCAGSSRSLRAAALAVVCSCIAAGCGTTGLETATLPSPSALSLPELPKLPDVSKIELPKAAPPVVGTPTEVYERVGRGAVSCWLGGRGPLKGTHIYEAAAEPAHKGGQAEIYIREKDADAQNPRGVRAYRVAIRPASDEKASVETENFKLADRLAQQMNKNVEAWAAGEEGCAAGGEVAGTDPAAALPATAAPTPEPVKPAGKANKPATASAAGVAPKPKP